MSDPIVDGAARARLQEAEEERWQAAGAALRTALERGPWREADRAGRERLLTRAHDLLRPAFELTRPTELSFVAEIEGKETGAGYDEESGIYILFPIVELDRDDPGPLVGGLAHELRHAYQHEVIDGVVEDPRREEWRCALGFYDADAAGYEWNPLELDAERAQVDVTVGYES